MLTALRFSNGVITHFDYDEGNRSLRVTGIARHAGRLRYRSDAGERYEYVPPEFNKALDSKGMPYVGQLGGLVVTNEHPPCLISHDSALRERFQVGEVQPQVKVYKDGRVEVTVEVYDSQTIDDIRSGRKAGFSCGYQTQVIKKDGVCKDGPYTHVQTEPIRFDHLAIVAHPRAPEALITRVDSDTRHADGFEVAWSADSYEENSMSLVQWLNRMDKGGSGPCGKGWVGTKPNCKRAEKGSAKKVKSETAALKKLGQSNLSSESKARLEELRAKKATLERRNEKKRIQRLGLPSDNSPFSAKAATGKGSKSPTVRIPEGFSTSGTARDTVVEIEKMAKASRDRIAAKRAAKAGATGKKKTDSLNLDSIMNLIQLLQRMDKGGSGPCGKGWVGTKPNCKRAPKGANSKQGAAKAQAESEALGNLGEKAIKPSRDKKISELKRKLQSKKSVDYQVKQQNQKRAAQGAQMSDRDRGKQAIRSMNTKKSVKNSLSALGLGDVAVDSLDFNKDSDMTHSVTLAGREYTLDSDAYLELLGKVGLDSLNLDSLNLDEEDEEMEDDEEMMDSANLDMDDEEEDEESDLPPAFLKNMKKMKAKKGKSDSADVASLSARIDELEGQLAIATRLLMDADEEEDEEMTTDSVDQAVQSRLDELFAAFDDARDYLPQDFKLDGSMTGADVKLAAIANFDSAIAERLDSAEAVEGAYALLKRHTRRDGVDMLRTAVDSANGGSNQPVPETRKDGGMKPLTYRKRS